MATWLGITILVLLSLIQVTLVVLAIKLFKKNR